MAHALNFVILHVRDIAAARDFYKETLGLGLEGESPAFVQFEVPGGATFALQKDEQSAPTANIELWWEVADVDAEHAALVKRGVEMVSGPQDQPFGRTLTFKDPEGNLVNLYRLKQA
jgi:predicted enzyme related to lactoylglutathione lyase